MVQSSGSLQEACFIIFFLINNMIHVQVASEGTGVVNQYQTTYMIWQCIDNPVLHLLEIHELQFAQYLHLHRWKRNL
jgi:hypothetical protein